MAIASIIISALAVIAAGCSVYWALQARKARRELQRLRMERFMRTSPFARQMRADIEAAATALGEKLLPTSEQIAAQVRDFMRRLP